MKFQKLIFIFLILFTVFFVSIKTNYPYPLHPDEYVHFAQARDILEKKNVEMINPYFDYQPYHLRLEIGFHIFLAIFMFITQENWIYFYPLLKFLVFFLNVYLLGILSWKLTNNSFIAYGSSFFLIFLKSSFDLLGNLFLLPVNVGLLIFLIFMHHLIDTKDIKRFHCKNFLYAMGIWFIMAWVYPPAAVLAALILFFQTIGFRENKALFFGIGVMVSMGGLLFLYLFKFNLKYVISTYLIFDSHWTPMQNSITPFTFFGLFNYFFALVGVFYLLQNPKKNSLFLLWFFIGFGNIVLFHSLGYSLFIPYRRVVFFFLILNCILAAIGVYRIFNFVLGFKSKKIITFFVALLILMSGVHVYNFYHEKPSISNFVLTPLKFDTLIYLKANYGIHNVIMTDPYTSFAIYPLTQNYVVALLDSNVGNGNRDDQLNFFNGDCSEKLEILHKFNVSLVLPDKPINCTFLIKKRTPQNIVFYEVSK